MINASHHYHESEGPFSTDKLLIIPRFFPFSHDRRVSFQLNHTTQLPSETSPMINCHTMRMFTK